MTLAGACFVLPTLVFSGLGGALADRFDKALLAERLKRWELPLAGIAAVGLLLHSLPLLFVALFGFGCGGGAVRTPSNTRSCPNCSTGPDCRSATR